MHQDRYEISAGKMTVSSPNKELSGQTQEWGSYGDHARIEVPGCGRPYGWAVRGESRAGGRDLGVISTASGEPREAARGGTAGPRRDGDLGRTQTTQKHKERGKEGLHKTPRLPRPERKEESQESMGDRGQRRRGSWTGTGTGSHVAAGRSKERSE